MSEQSQHPETQPPPSLFPETRWSVVLRARGTDPVQSQRAMAELCQHYWYPLYAFARRKGLAPVDSEDSVQGFFHHVLAMDFFENVDEENGKLRAFLLASLKNFLNKQRRDGTTKKRGAGAVHLAFDAAVAEQWFQNEPSLPESPDTLFDRNWALALLERVFARLEDHYDRADKRRIYQAIRPCLQGDGSYGKGDELAAELSLSSEGLRSAVFKLRRRFKEYVEEEIRETCRHDGDFEDEIRHLCRILAEQ